MPPTLAKVPSVLADQCPKRDRWLGAGQRQLGHGNLISDILLGAGKIGALEFRSLGRQQLSGRSDQSSSSLTEDPSAWRHANQDLRPELPKNAPRSYPRTPRFPAGPAPAWHQVRLTRIQKFHPAPNLTTSMAWMQAQFQIFSYSPRAIRQARINRAEADTRVRRRTCRQQAWLVFAKAINDANRCAIIRLRLVPEKLGWCIVKL
jgi:hypothetical protein